MLRSLKQKFGMRPSFARHRGIAPRLQVEALEDRQLLSTNVLFHVWTQNTRLLPSDLFPTATIAATSFLNPPLGLAMGLAESAYAAILRNTPADNEQRANIFLDRAASGGHDIVALQEVWDFRFVGDNWGQVVDGARDDGFSVVEGPGRAGVEANSGLATLVRGGHTTSQSRTTVYAEDGPTLEFDNWAQKGASLTRVHFNGNASEYVWVVNTHLLAPPQYRAERAAQLQQLRQFIDSNANTTHPVLYLGDFNIDSNDVNDRSEYDAMLSALGLTRDNDPYFRSSPTFATADPARSAYECHWNEGGSNCDQKPRKRLDYMLIRQGSEYRVELVSQTLADSGFRTDVCRDNWQGWLNYSPATRVCYPSDHFGLQAGLRLVKPVSVTDGVLTIRGGAGRDIVTLDRIATSDFLTPELVVTTNIGGISSVNRFSLLGITSVSIQTGGGDDEINVMNFSGAPITVNAGDGAGDALHVYSGGSLFPEPAPAVRWTVTSTSIARSGSLPLVTVNYGADLENLELHGHAITDLFNLQTTTASTSVRASGGGGRDYFYVGNANVLEHGGPLRLDGQGDQDHVVFNDSHTTTAQTYTMTTPLTDGSVATSGRPALEVGRPPAVFSARPPAQPPDCCGR